MFAGSLDRITIKPGRTMRVIGTVIGPIKKYIGEKSCHSPFSSLVNTNQSDQANPGKMVMISQLDDRDDLPIEPQV